MNEVHGRCKLWACRSARILKGFSGRRLNIKRRVGVLLGGTGGWILRMAFSYKAKTFRTTAFFPRFRHTAFYFPPFAKANGPPLSPERETFCMLPLISFRMLAFCKREYSALLLQSLGIARSRESVQNAYQDFLKSRKLNSRACLFCLLFPRYNKWKMTE